MSEVIAVVSPATLGRTFESGWTNMRSAHLINPSRRHKAFGLMTRSNEPTGALTTGHQAIVRFPAICRALEERRVIGYTPDTNPKMVYFKYTLAFSVAKLLQEHNAFDEHVLKNCINPLERAGSRSLYGFKDHIRY
ncbi:hypothetical protein TNCV_2929421 [Trichonephila clavipes]|nr:hypothetical protein TNCV_2929421 [Trichonephila clavipes]